VQLSRSFFPEELLYKFLAHRVGSVILISSDNCIHVNNWILLILSKQVEFRTSFSATCIQASSVLPELSNV
jgi:hypothetical protein